MLSGKLSVDTCSTHEPYIVLPASIFVESDSEESDSELSGFSDVPNGQPDLEVANTLIDPDTAMSVANTLIDPDTAIAVAANTLIDPDTAMSVAIDPDPEVANTFIDPDTAMSVANQLIESVTPDARIPVNTIELGNRLDMDMIDDIIGGHDRDVDDVINSIVSQNVHR